MPSTHATARWRIVLEGDLLHLEQAIAASTRFAPFGLHNAALPSVPASRCAEAPLGAGHRFAPFG